MLNQSYNFKRAPNASSSRGASTTTYRTCGNLQHVSHGLEFSAIACARDGACALGRREEKRSTTTGTKTAPRNETYIPRYIPT